MSHVRVIVVLIVLLALGCELGSARAGEGREAADTERAQAEPAQSEEVQMVDTVDMANHAWKHRVLLLFAPGPDDADYETMHRALDARDDGVEERDLVVYHLFFDEEGQVGEQEVSPEATRQLAEQYDVRAGGFTYVLIGKDGTVKNRADEAVAVDDIFARIDSMPMRRREMRQE